MNWTSYYTGDGVKHRAPLPPMPPWRRMPRTDAPAPFTPPPGLADAVNAALCLRRPLLVTGTPGTGKSTLIEHVAAELDLGPVLRWHITSRSELADALYRYDALGRIHAQRLGEDTDDIASFLRLGPLGSALLPAERPRALLIDEIDKSDLDLPGDLLDVLESGRFEIPELVRYKEPAVEVRLWESDETTTVEGGRVACTEFPFIVMTSNGEQDFPPPFLRRCMRYTMPAPDRDTLTRVLRAHLDLTDPPSGQVVALIEDFLARTAAGDTLALDQLLNTVFLLSGRSVPDVDQRERLVGMLMRDLSRA